VQGSRISKWSAAGGAFHHPARMFEQMPEAGEKVRPADQYGVRDSRFVQAS
jgi:hypothetical protein